MMNTMMEETLLTGTARKAELPGWQAAGKTGTSQDWRDAWFVGYTSHLVAGVWLGNDDNSPTQKASGGNLPVEIWSRFMKTAHQGVPVAGLPSGAWRAAAPEPARLADSVLNLFGAGPAAPPPRAGTASPAASFSRGVAGRRRRTKRGEARARAGGAAAARGYSDGRNETRGKKSAAEGRGKELF